MAKKSTRRQDSRPAAQRTGRSTPRRNVLLGLVAVSVVLALVFAWPGVRPAEETWPESFTSGAARGFNVLVITLDTTRADRLGCYGHAGAQTPHLDGLAAEGIRFADAVTVAPITLPAHATIFTGLDPPQHGVRDNGEFELSAAHTTLAEMLEALGYETAAFVSAFVLDARFGLNQGFEQYDDQVTPLSATDASAFVNPIYERPADRVTDAAMDWLRTRKAGRPFFCWVHYFDPHSPYSPPAAFAARFADRLYDGEIAFMDSQIGRLVSALQSSGVWDRTLTIVVGDHGESLGEHGESTHAKLIYESTMRVPLLIACPALVQGPHVVSDVVVSVADVVPTVLDLLGIAVSDALDGRSLLAARTDRDRIVYQETLAPYFDNGWSALFGLRRHQDKYIAAPGPEYYNLQADPRETTNLFRRATGAARASRDHLADRLATMLASAPSVEAIAKAAVTPDAETLRRLESLGYVGTMTNVPDGRALPDPKDMMVVQQQVDRASAMARGGDYENALALLQQAALQSRQDPILLLTIGKTYLFMDRVADAEAAFRRAHSIRPSARVAILLAQIMLADGRLDPAAEMLDQAEALEPTHGGIYLARGDLFALRARPDDAIAAYEKAINVDPYRASAEAQRRIDQLREFMRRAGQP